MSHFSDLAHPTSHSMRRASEPLMFRVAHDEPPRNRANSRRWFSIQSDLAALTNPARVASGLIAAKLVTAAPVDILDESSLNARRRMVMKMLLSFAALSFALAWCLD